jgi:surface polysaccharide O-acyltransferase-like enzyme
MATTKSSLGIGRLLIAGYATLALAATGRASYELIAKFDQAPLPYALSAFSALVYVVATIALARSDKNWRKVAWLAVTIELIGVIVIGSASFLLPDVFNYEGVQVRTVWSYFGIAYGCVPLVLPILGLLWLRRVTRN